MSANYTQIWCISMDTSGLIEIQTLQEKINKLIRDSQVQAVKGNFEKHSIGSKSWWSTVNSLTGRKSTNTPISSIISPNEINKFFFVLLTLIPFINPLMPSLFQNRVRFLL